MTNDTMADMPTDFWSGWIVVITTVSVLGLIWLIFSIYFSANQHEELESPVWDQTLREGNNPAPMWWFWMVLIALIISVIYLMLYPGLGSFSGMLKWSQGSRLDLSLTHYAIQYAGVRQKITQTPIAELQQDMKLMDSAKRVFNQNCAACHGQDAQGQASTFPNLKDTDWQWGSSEKDIEHSIKKGRQAAMIGWKNIIGEEGVSQVASFIKTLASDDDSASNSQGKQIYQQNCVACHGIAGEGNAALGAPKLADDIWLYGNSESALRHSIAVGRNGVMPAFEKRLDEAQIRILVAWLMQNDNNATVVAANSKENTETSETINGDDTSLGEQIYTSHCTACHQSNGEGLPGVFPSLIGNATVLNDNPSEHIDIVLNGLQNKVIDGVNYPAPMLGFAEKLNDEEVAAVVNHERSQWGNNAIQINSAAVTARR